MMASDARFGFIGTICFLLACFAVHIYFDGTGTYLNVAVPIKHVHPTDHNVTSARDPAAFRLMKATGTHDSLPVRESKIRTLLISPDKIPKTLLSRLDRSTRDSFLFNLKHMKGEKGKSVDETYGRENLVDAYEVLGSMGYSSRLPDVINIGVKKGGTTALMFYLKNHPQIQTSLDAREVHFFDWHYDSGLRWYESRMKVARKDQLVYEKTPRYFIHPRVAKRVHRDLGGDLRFLLCVRDPVARLISDFHFSKQIRASKSWKRQQTADKEGNRFRRTILEKNGSIKTDDEMVLSSNYAFHFKRWLEYYRREQFLIIDNHDMVNNISETLRRVESFLGLRAYYQKGMFLKTKKGQTCLRIKSRTTCPRNIGSSMLPKPEVSAELEQKLRDYYRPLNREFEILADRKFDWTDF